MLLSVHNLRVTLPLPDGSGSAAVVRDVSFDVPAGGFHALVGESGCGKSMTVLALGALPPCNGTAVAGSIQFEGRELTGLSAADHRAFLREGAMSFVFQDPMSTLHPTLSLRTQLFEAMPDSMPRAEREREALRLLALVDLPAEPAFLRKHACELSGGMAQRACIAMAMAQHPRLLVADEPTTALDVLVQGKVLELLARIRREQGTAILLITHNLGIVAQHADTLSVLYAGETIETGRVADVLRAPQHPYTDALLKAVPRLTNTSVEELAPIPGRVPAPGEPLTPCAFAPRCPRRTPACDTPPPANTHVRCNKAG